jgi:hypothetical protein
MNKAKAMYCKLRLGQWADKSETPESASYALKVTVPLHYTGEWNRVKGNEIWSQEEWCQSQRIGEGTHD